MADKYVDASVVKNFSSEVSLDDLILQVAQHRRAIKNSYKAYVDFVSYIMKVFQIPTQKRADAIDISVKMLPGVWSNLIEVNAKNDLIVKRFKDDIKAIDTKKIHSLTFRRFQYIVTDLAAFEPAIDTPNPPGMKQTSIGVAGVDDMGVIPVLIGIAIVSIAGIYITGRVCSTIDTSEQQRTIRYLAYERIRDKEIEDSKQARQQIIDTMAKLYKQVEENIDKMTIGDNEKNKMKKDAAETYMEKLLKIPVNPSSATTAPEEKGSSVFNLDMAEISKYLLIATGIAAGAYVAGKVIGIVGKK